MEIDLEKPELKVVLPGDPINVTKKENIKLGPGLTQTQDSIICIKAGILNHTSVKNKWWVENNQRRYIPAEKESVIGTVTYKGGEFYRLDIGSAHQAILPILAFENANKKNRPNLNIGSLIYARISLANKDMEPELTCVNPESNKADGYGELKGGFVIKCSLRYCRRFFSGEIELISLLELLQKKKDFEMAIGMNGRIWITSTSIKDTIFCCNVIKGAENLNCSDINKVANSLGI
ncbi:hypothetical protein C1645_749004 [Glomus cerebriforme]|uniref:Ribosomal RNA-processing protein 40 n=1 Tax=Glomus cerebriforme TaxID=658196 RepID=A0A397TUY0_9GLOM|nr:hypothetical protein C1645_749004 [Glomus cerebriforme]